MNAVYIIYAELPQNANRKIRKYVSAKEFDLIRTGVTASITVGPNTYAISDVRVVAVKDATGETNLIDLKLNRKQ